VFGFFVEFINFQKKFGFNDLDQQIRS